MISVFLSKKTNETCKNYFEIKKSEKYIIFNKGD